MHRKPWFTIDSQYTPDGIDVTFFNEKVNLTLKDICYLLCEIDVLATHLTIPLETIPFGVYGHDFEVTDMQWLQFVDALTSVVVQAGWNSDCCEPPKKWFVELIRSQQR